jgi:hypothetical protein
MSLVLWFYTVGGAGAIIVAVMHQLTHGKVEHKQLSQATIWMTPKWKLRLVRKMMNSAVFGQIIILIVYLPGLPLRESRKCSMAQTKLLLPLKKFYFIDIYSGWCFVFKQKS